MKKVCSVLLTVLLMCGIVYGSIVPVGASSGTCGEGVYWSLEDGVLRIYGEGAMEEYSSSMYETRAPWAEQRDEVYTLVVEDGVTRVGSNAFFACGNLQTATLADSVESVGECAFQECSEMTSMDLGSGIRRIDGGAFFGCFRLSDVEFPTGLQSIGIEAFLSCGLVSLRLPDSVAEVGAYAFAECTQLTEVSFSQAMTVIPDSCFYKCTSLRSVTVPGWITAIESGAFAACTQLQSVTLSEGIVSIGGATFWDCPSLTNLSIPASVTEMNGLSNIQNLATIELAEGSQAFRLEDGILFSKDGKCLVKYPPGRQGESYTVPDTVECIAPYAFGNTHLSSVILPKGLRTVEEGLFMANSALRKITIPEGVTRIGTQAFAACSVLTEVTLPDSVTYIDPEAFDPNRVERIFGFAGSAAEQYATENNIVFETISAEPLIPGDVNGDGSVNSSDARLILQYTVELAVFSDRMLAAADVNGDSAVNSTDARIVLQQAVGIDS